MIRNTSKKTVHYRSPLNRLHGALVSNTNIHLMPWPTLCLLNRAAWIIQKKSYHAWIHNSFNHGIFRATSCLCIFSLLLRILFCLPSVLPCRRGAGISSPWWVCRETGRRIRCQRFHGKYRSLFWAGPAAISPRRSLQPPSGTFLL